MSLPPFLRALQNPVLFPHPADDFQVLETHGAWVLLTGEYAYKFKKPLDFGFMDFSTLEKRHHCCQEEIRLNRRLAPQIYVDTVPLYGTAQSPHWEGGGEVLEYAVKMRRFDSALMLDKLAAAEGLQQAWVDDMSAQMAAFHQSLPPAPADSVWGEPTQVYAPQEENFQNIRRCLGATEQPELDALENWVRACYTELKETFQTRRREGFVRECHGDMHLGNMVLYQDKVLIFDALEFNPALRWIDVMSEAAFLYMDMQERNRPEAAARMLNAYLEQTGDYEGLPVLRFYLVYRALVRAKVALLRREQMDDAQQRGEAEREYAAYFSLAQSYTRPSPVFLCITHGVSGSGKTTLSQALLEKTGALRLRSDVERKRRPPPGELYSTEARGAVYQRLAALSRIILRAGFSLVVDAAFLDFNQRDAFRRLAAEEQAKFFIAACRAPSKQLNKRVAQRRTAGRDASEADGAVLQKQLAEYQALRAEETAYTYNFDTAENTAVQLRELLVRINHPFTGF